MAQIEKEDTTLVFKTALASASGGVSEVKMKESLISRDPKICFGAYRVRAKRVPVSAIKSRWRGGESVESIMDDYDLTPEELEAALTFRDSRVKVFAEYMRRYLP